MANLGKTERVRDLAERFRTAMESTDFADTKALRHFPKNACDFTSKLLGRFLYENRIRDIAIMSGKSPVGEGNHEWLRVGELCVDITADQFEEEDQPSVVVAEDSSWHERLTGKEHIVFDDDYYNTILTGHYFPFVRDMYDRIMSTLAEP